MLSPSLMIPQEGARWMVLQEGGISQEAAGNTMLPEERLAQKVTRGRLLQQGGLAQEVAGESALQQEMKHPIYLQQLAGSNHPAAPTMRTRSDKSLDTRGLYKPWPQGLHSTPAKNANRPPMPSSFQSRMESKPYNQHHPVQNSLHLPNSKPSLPDINAIKTKASFVTSPWFCPLCKLSATSKQSLEDHLQGKRHKKEAAKLGTNRIGVGLPSPESIRDATIPQSVREAHKSLLWKDSPAVVPLNAMQKIIPSQISERKHDVYMGGSPAGLTLNVVNEMMPSQICRTKHQLYLQDFLDDMPVNVLEEMMPSQIGWREHELCTDLTAGMPLDLMEEMVTTKICRGNHAFYFEESNMNQGLHCEESKPKFFDALLPNNNELHVHAVQEEEKVLFPSQEGAKIYSQKSEKKNEKQRLKKDQLQKVDTLLDIEEADHFPPNRSFNNKAAEVFISDRCMENTSAARETLTGSDQVLKSCQVAKEKRAGSRRGQRGKAKFAIDKLSISENECKEISRNEVDKVGYLNDDVYEMSKPAEEKQSVLHHENEQGAAREKQVVTKQQTEANAEVAQEPACLKQEEKPKPKVIKLKFTKGEEMAKSARRKLVIPEEENEENIAEIANEKPASLKPDKKATLKESKLKPADSHEMATAKKKKQADSKKKKRPSRRILVDPEEEAEDNAVRAPLMQENKGKPKALKLKQAGHDKEQEQICMKEYNENIQPCNEEITGFEQQIVELPRYNQEEVYFSWFQKFEEMPTFNEEDFAGFEQENLEMPMVGKDALVGMPQNLRDKARVMKEELFGSDQEEEEVEIHHPKEFVPLMKKRKAVTNLVHVADENHPYPDQNIMEMEGELHGAVQDRNAGGDLLVAADEGAKTVVLKNLNSTNRVKTRIKIKSSSKKSKDATNDKMV